MPQGEKSGLGEKVESKWTKSRGINGNRYVSRKVEMLKNPDFRALFPTRFETNIRKTISTNASSNMILKNSALLRNNFTNSFVISKDKWRTIFDFLNKNGMKVEVTSDLSSCQACDYLYESLSKSYSMRKTMVNKGDCLKVSFDCLNSVINCIYCTKTLQVSNFDKQ